MSGLHAMYSIGVLVGALVGSLVARAGVDPLVHFAVAGASLTVLAAFLSPSLLGREVDIVLDLRSEDRSERRPMRLLDHPLLMAAGIIAFCCMFTEGSVDDWSGVFLREVRHVSYGVAPLGAAACGAGMTAGRFCGDAVIKRFGRKSVLWRAAILASAGMSLAVLAPTVVLAIIGYAVLGLGVATIVPIAFTLAGNTRGTSPPWAISRVTTVGYAGLFCSPAVIGLVSHETGLTEALMIPAGLILLVVPLSRIAS